MIEEADVEASTEAVTAPVKPVPLTDVLAQEGAHRPTGIGELDRVLGGGLVQGSVTLLSGEPGVGKSTLIVQLLASLARSGRPVLLATAEESAEQVRQRAERVATVDPLMHVMAATVLPQILDAARDSRPTLLVIDSIQTVFDPALGSAPGSVAQVREGAAQLVRLAKEHSITTMLVGHVTKEGMIAGPRVLEHLVDTVLAFEGDAHQTLRFLRSSKNRFGATGEIGVFEMRSSGLAPVADPSGLFLADRHRGAPGSIVTPVQEGSRPLLVEIQALVTPTSLTLPRRNLSGLDAARVALIAGILEKRLGLPMGKRDIYAQAAGGVRIGEPAADLAIALALVSAETEVALADRLAAVGELGLGGELRRVPFLRHRLDEVRRLGFEEVVVPAAATGADLPEGLSVLRAETLRDAIDALELVTLGVGPGSERQ
jgi:DNA repair protein RadA/Sms